MSALDDTLARLRNTQARITGLLPHVVRPYRSALEASKFLMLQGPRGVGKTSYLLRRASDLDGVYLSADHPLLASHPLFEWVETLYAKGVERVFIDEVHQGRDWSASLKTLHDSYPDKGIWVSGSSSLLLEEGIVDLSRRYPRSRMPFLSFREYLVLTGSPDFGVHDPFLPDQGWVEPILKSTNVLAKFEEYLSFGSRPIFLEGRESYGTKVLQTIQKTMESDIPHMVASLQSNHIHLMNAMLGHLAQAPIPTLSVNSLCREWSVGKEKLYNLLQALERTGVLHVVRKPTDHAAASIGAKIFFADPTLYSVLSGLEGNTREAYVVSALRDAGREIQASSDETKADFLLDQKKLLEVGGPKKVRKDADFVIRDGIDWPAPGVIPLWMLGFLI